MPLTVGNPFPEGWLAQTVAGALTDAGLPPRFTRIFGKAKPGSSSSRCGNRNKAPPRNALRALPRRGQDQIAGGHQGGGFAVFVLHAIWALGCNV
jgi:hypothetical protein